MRWFAILLLFALAGCGKGADPKSQGAAVSKPAADAIAATAQPMIGGKAAAEMHLIPIPKDKAQLDRMLAMGYTVHRDHMHPPGVKECPFDKNGGGVIE